MENTKNMPLNKSTFFAMISFGLMQLIIFFTNRSQILYINQCNYHSFYRLIFIILYPLGFIIGSLWNQFLVKRFGLNGTYFVLFSTTCITLLSNILYESPFSWLFFRFIYSTNIASLFWIFNDYFSLKNPELSQKFHYSFAKLTFTKLANILSNIMITINFIGFHQMTVVSVILLQMAQTFFSINNNKLNLAKPLNELKFNIDIYTKLYEKNLYFLIFFLLFITIYQTYNIWLILIISHLNQIHNNYKLLIIVLSLGEIISSYIFLKEDDIIPIDKRLFYGGVLFAAINFLLFMAFFNNNHFFLFPLFFIGGILISKFNKDLEYLIFSYGFIEDKDNFDFSNTIIKNLFHIVILIITFYMANNKAPWIFFLLSILYGIFIFFLYKKYIILSKENHKIF